MNISRMEEFKMSKRGVKKQFDARLPLLHMEQKKIDLLGGLAKIRGEDRAKTIRTAIDIGVKVLMEDAQKNL